MEPSPNPPRRQARTKSALAGQGSAFRSGRTIGERRERVETASERLAARTKTKREKRARIIVVVLGFTGLAALGAAFFSQIFFASSEPLATKSTLTVPYSPTIEITDADASATGGRITAKMREYVGQLEADLRSYGYVPTRAMIPAGSVREVDIYLDGYHGYLKATIDRGAGVTAEDADRVLRYLAERGIADFEYVDLRLDGKAYWK